MNRQTFIIVNQILSKGKKQKTDVIYPNKNLSRQSPTPLTIFHNACLLNKNTEDRHLIIQENGKILSVCKTNLTIKNQIKHQITQPTKNAM